MTPPTETRHSMRTTLLDCLSGSTRPAARGADCTATSAP